MSRMYNDTILFTHEVKTAEDIVELLKKCGDIDADFSGENGDEYLWNAAKRNKFKTNAEYLANKVVFKSSANVKKKGIEAYTEKFAQLWLKMDSYWCDIHILIEKVCIPERHYTDNLQGTYAVCVNGNYLN